MSESGTEASDELRYSETEREVERERVCVD
jgi:hypothetical protein